MKSNEFRVNNLISNKGDYFKVVEILEGRLICIPLTGYFKIKEVLFFDDITPIQLTIEILEKAGFEVTGWDNSIFSLFLSEHDEHEMQRQRIDFWHENTHGKAELCRSGVCFKMVPCQNVYQLQNLYFTLTGEELKIEL